MAVVRHLGFLKFGRLSVGCSGASPCQIIQNRSNDCGDFAIFLFVKTAIGHLGFVGQI